MGTRNKYIYIITLRRCTHANPQSCSGARDLGDENRKLKKPKQNAGGRDEDGDRYASSRGNGATQSKIKQEKLK